MFNLTNVPSQQGRVAIVTGANTGLGYETALGLAQKEATVVLACRSQDKAEKAKADILKKVPNAAIDILLIDLSKLSSVREAASNFLSKYDRLDLLINNAGVMMPPYTKTEDGFELQMGVNYFSHFLLTGLLLDTLEKTPNSRIVTLSSIAHRQGQINFDDLHCEQDYNRQQAYADSKLACTIFNYELQRRLDKAGYQTISTTAHPGLSDTDLARHFPKILLFVLRPIFYLFMMQSAKAGAEPTLYAALGEDIEGGDYTGPSGKNEYRGKATKVRSASRARDEAVGRQLWQVSEKLTGLTFLS